MKSTEVSLIEGLFCLAQYVEQNKLSESATLHSIHSTVFSVSSYTQTRD